MSYKSDRDAEIKMQLQSGWAKRMLEVMEHVYEEPCVTIPISWLGIDPDSAKADAKIIAMEYRQFQAMKHLMASQATELLNGSLQSKRAQSGV
jgi:hypothetical protein